MSNQACSRKTIGTDLISGICPECMHNTGMHPGISNPDGKVTECLACIIVEVRKKFVADEDGQLWLRRLDY